MRDEDGYLLPLGLFNIAVGVLIAIQGASRHRSWGGAVNLLCGLLMAWSWWAGGGRDRCKRALGAKSAAVRAALARRVRELAPVTR